MNMRDEPDAKRQKLVGDSYSSIKVLPDELVIEILCRLPDCKFAFQCKCISKHWFSLISSPYFIRSFVAAANNKMKFNQPYAFVYFQSMVERLYKSLELRFPPYKADRKEASTVLNLVTSYPGTFKSNDFSLEFLPCYRGEDDRPIITILKTYDDLILCCEEKFNKKESCAYYICNPRTKQWVALPPTPPHDLYKCIEVEFICEPYYYTDEKGMVILNSQFKFKVLRFLRAYPSRKIRFQIFSSETGQWDRDITRISMPPKSPEGFIVRSLLCKDKVSLICLTRRYPDLTLRAITLDHHNQSLHRVVYYQGSRFCRPPFRSVMHLSLQYGSIIIMVQIYVNVAASQPDYGVPVLLISRLNKSLTKWKLWHRVSFREMTSQNKWISDVYLKKTFALRENRQQHSTMPIVLGFHPYSASHLYLNLNCESDLQMGLYNVRTRTLNFVSKCWHHSSVPRYQMFCCHLWSAVSRIVLPSWPTPIPQISLSQSQEAALPCQDYSLT